MLCANDAIGDGKTNAGIAITHYHFNASLHATEATPEPPRLLLAG
jgi:hypothetical protein